MTSAKPNDSAPATGPSAGGALFDADALEDFVARAFREVGLDERAAGDAADVLVRTSLRGVESHGISYLHQYVRQLREGGAQPTARVRPAQERGPVTILDGADGLGPAVAVEATRRGIEQAREHGVGLVTVRNANHFGAAGHYALMCAEAGCVGLVMANTPPIMAVTGSRSRTIGNSPLGFGAPRTEAPPMVLDIAMSRVAGGKVRMALQDGREVPLGWILDPEGNPSTSPEDFLVRLGALLPMEGHKGYGLALMVEALAGALSGAAVLGEVHNWIYSPDTPSGTGYFMLVIDVSSASLFAPFAGRLAELCGVIAGSPRAPGVDRILVPGELEHDHEQDARAHGLHVSREINERLETLADSAGLTEVLAQARLT
jgi:LDH2 family malate/lactate/ureidoglycolate dehydrogenase